MSSLSRVLGWNEIRPHGSSSYAAFSCARPMLSHSINVLWKGGETVMAKGTVKWFNEQKGFGFIAPEEGEDLFVHRTSIKEDGSMGLCEGDEVEFDVAPGRKGMQAIDVVKC